jgi:hypothetical protein
MKLFKQCLAVLFFTMILIGFESTRNVVHSQTLKFCEDVDDRGNPINPSTIFYMGKDGGNIKFLTELPYSIGTNKVSYEMFQVVSNEEENYFKTIHQDVQPGWKWFWKKYTFYKEGRFNVYVYDGDNNLLTSSQLRIQYY